jgi:hypothetical protein
VGNGGRRRGRSGSTWRKGLSPDARRLGYVETSVVSPKNCIAGWGESGGVGRLLVCRFGQLGHPARFSVNHLFKMVGNYSFRRNIFKGVEVSVSA